MFTSVCNEGGEGARAGEMVMPLHIISKQKNKLQILKTCAAISWLNSCPLHFLLFLLVLLLSKEASCEIM